MERGKRTVPVIGYPSNLHREFAEGIFRRIEEFYDAELVSLAVFGSYARGTPRGDSDLDLFIILNEAGRRNERNRCFVERVELPYEKTFLSSHERLPSMEVSPVILSAREAGNFLPLYLDMTSESVLLSDRQGFLSNRLKKVAEQMKRWGSRRREAGGHWYWEIRPGLRVGEVMDYDE